MKMRSGLPLLVVIGFMCPLETAHAQPAEGGGGTRPLAAPTAPTSTEGQEDTNAPSAEQSETPPAGETTAEDEEAAALKEEADAARDAELTALKERLAGVEAQLEEMSVTAALAGDEQEAAQQEKFSIYGFMDMGLQYIKTPEDSIVAGYFESNTATFAVGNIDIYFDFNPHPDWRGLAEIRFTNAPHGNITNFGGIAGTFERTTTQQYDPHAAVLNAQMWGGTTVIERAWIDWQKYQAFRVRTGAFFTPIGIWNVDHGTPTLISIAAPQSVQQLYFPIRQVGVQALGSFFLDDTELAYRAWLSNGRQELANLDFTSDKAFGARAFLSRNKGPMATQVGASFHHGRVADKIVDIEAPPPALTFNIHESFAYHETIVGADLSLDLNKTRLRVEYVGQLRLFEEGKRLEFPPTSPTPGAEYPDHWRHSAYAIVAQELPFAGLEPYLYTELTQQHWDNPDALLVLAPGLNLRFSPVAQLKLQVTWGKFFDWLEESAPAAYDLDTTTYVSRLVLAF